LLTDIASHVDTARRAAPHSEWLLTAHLGAVAAVAAAAVDRAVRVVVAGEAAEGRAGEGS
jgi:hypothetical protein